MLHNQSYNKLLNKISDENINDNSKQTFCERSASWRRRQTIMKWRSPGAPTSRLTASCFSALLLLLLRLTTTTMTICWERWRCGSQIETGVTADELKLNVSATDRWFLAAVRHALKFTIQSATMSLSVQATFICWSQHVLRALISVWTAAVATARRLWFTSAQLTRFLLRRPHRRCPEWGY